jgi:hypothetical protein
MVLATDQMSWKSRHVANRRGRPWAERAVWGALWLLSTGETPDWLAEHQPSRIRRRLQTMRPSGLLWAMRPRAAVHRFRASERVLAATRAHVVVSGVGAIGEDAGGLHLEGYVTPERFDWLSSDFPIVPDDSTPNLVLRVSRLASQVEGGIMPIGFAAADMADSAEQSEAERGWLILDDLLRSFTGQQRDWLTVAEFAAAIAGEVDGGDEVFALRVLAKALSDVRSLSEPADVIRFLQKPTSTGDRRWDVLVASAVARECRLRRLDAPQWTDAEGVEPWWFPALIDETLLPLTIQRTPPELARKGVWLDERALEVI